MDQPRRQADHQRPCGMRYRLKRHCHHAGPLPGFNLVQIGVFLSVGVAGSACFALVVSLSVERVGRRRLLVAFTSMSVAAVLALAFVDGFLPLMFGASLGSIAGGVAAGGAVQSLGQANLADTASAEKRTNLFTVYRILAVSGGALGALVAGLPVVYQNAFGISEIVAFRVMFVSFAGPFLVGALLYGLLFLGVEVAHTERQWVDPLRLPSRRLIFKLTGLFSLDHFAGSLFLETLAAYWFYSRFGLELESLALVFFVSRTLAAVSLWVTAKLANRIGLINTMVFTHIPASIFLIGAAFGPTAWLAILFWQLRAFLSMMDLPTRNSYTMSVVQPHERVAMGGIHVVGRSIAGTVGPSVGTALWQAVSASPLSSPVQP